MPRYLKLQSRSKYQRLDLSKFQSKGKMKSIFAFYGHPLTKIVIGLSTKMLDHYCVSHSNLCALYCQGTSIETDICVQNALHWVIYPLTQPRVANQQKIQTALHCGGLNTKHVSIVNGPKVLVGEWFCF